MITLKQVIHYPDTNSVEATWVDENDVQVRCHSYADVQMDMLEADLGADLPEHTNLIATVRANIQPVKPPSVEEILAMLTSTVQQRLDTFARTRGYENILSACTYATSTNSRFAPEGQYCVNARDATWAKCYEIMGNVQQGLRAIPTQTELLAELPVLTWPV